MNLLVQLLGNENLVKIYQFRWCDALLRLRTLSLHQQDDIFEHQ